MLIASNGKTSTYSSKKVKFCKSTQIPGLSVVLPLYSLSRILTHKFSYIFILRSLPFMVIVVYLFKGSSSKTIHIKTFISKPVPVAQSSSFDSVYLTESSMACQRSLSGNWCEFSWLILFSGIMVDAKENYFKKLRILVCTHLREKYNGVFCLF